MPVAPLVIVADRHSQEDLLFWPTLARALAARPPGPGSVILHAPGESVDRAMEAAGFDASDPEHDGRPGAGSPDQAGTEWAAVFRRAVIEENRRIAAMLTEEGISAVGFIGSVRGLLDRSDAPWFVQLTSQGVVAVVASARETGGVLTTADLAGSAAHLARVLAAPVVWLSSGLISHKNEEISVAEAVASGARRDVLETLLGKGISVIISGVSGLNSEQPGCPVMPD